jgi:hypothetical protein
MVMVLVARISACMVLLLGLALVSTREVAACSGGRLFNEPNGKFTQAEMIFVGTVVKRDEPLILGSYTSADPIGWTFAVDSIEKGPRVDRVRVESARISASCGFEFKFGQRYRVFAYRVGGALQTGQGDVTQVEALPKSIRPPTEPGGISGIQLSFDAVAGAAGLILMVGVAAWLWFDRQRVPTR